MPCCIVVCYSRHPCVARILRRRRDISVSFVLSVCLAAYRYVIPVILALARILRRRRVYISVVCIISMPCCIVVCYSRHPCAARILRRRRDISVPFVLLVCLAAYRYVILVILALSRILRRRRVLFYI
jgi:hypothetical protein